MSQHLHSRELTDIIDIYKSGVSNGVYEDKINLLRFYEILAQIEVKKSDDYRYNYSSTMMWINRYLQDNETPSVVFAFISGLLALFREEKYSTDDTIEFANRVYRALADNKLSLATPFLMNLRLKDGNLSSCFTGNVPDNMEGIFDYVKDFAITSKNGGGQGLYLGDIRAKGSMIKGVYGRSDSVIPVSSIFNQTAVFSNQNGKRLGAITLSLPTYHADILEFLELQTESGDSRRKAFDIFPQLIANGDFMHCVRYKLDYPIVCPHEVKEVLGIDLTNEPFPLTLLVDKLNSNTLKVGKVVKARTIFKAIVSALLVKGTPYITFHENIQKMNPAKGIGTIKTGNLCQESFSITNENYTHVCNLMSVVLPNVEDNEFEEVVNLGIEILNLITDYTTYPTEKAKRHAEDFKVVGLGAIGLHDYLAKNNLTYNDVKEIEIIFEKMALYSHKASINLAKKHGTFRRYEDSEFPKGIILGKSLDWFIANSNGFVDEWTKVFKDLGENGIANLQLNAYMPSTSTSILMGVTAGMLPTYSKFYYDTSSIGSLPIFPKYLKEKFWYYKEYVHHDVMQMNTLIGKATQWIDTGISYEVVMNLDKTSIFDLMNFYVDAWEKGIKTIYYIRWIRESGMDAKDECISCAG